MWEPEWTKVRPSLHQKSDKLCRCGCAGEVQVDTTGIGGSDFAGVGPG